MGFIDRVKDVKMLAKIRVSNSEEVMRLLEDYDGDLTNSKDVMFFAVNTNGLALQ